MGFWLEVVTLLVPGFNDSSRELDALARFLSGVSPDIPWHVTAFHPAYRMTALRSTPANALLRAALIGREAGLRYVYAGNLGGLGELENTRCSCCDTLLIERHGFHVLLNCVTTEGRCPSCGTKIPGIWRAARQMSTASDLSIDRRCG
jgi:pyruvate formate lyase activating enzyme